MNSISAKIVFKSDNLDMKDATSPNFSWDKSLSIDAIYNLDFLVSSIAQKPLATICISL